MSDELAELQRKIANLQRRLRRAAKRKKVRADKVDKQSLVLFIFPDIVQMLLLIFTFPCRTLSHHWTALWRM